MAASPTAQLYHYRPEQGLLCLSADNLASLELPILFIEQSLELGQLLVEPLAPTHAIWDSVEPEFPRLRACFPLKRHKGLEAVVYLEDPAPSQSPAPTPAAEHPVADALSCRQPGEPATRGASRSGAGSAAPRELTRSRLGIY